MRINSLLSYSYKDETIRILKSVISIMIITFYTVIFVNKGSSNGTVYYLLAKWPNMSSIKGQIFKDK